MLTTKRVIAGYVQGFSNSFKRFCAKTDFKPFAIKMSFFVSDISDKRFSPYQHILRPMEDIKVGLQHGVLVLRCRHCITSRTKCGNKGSEIGVWFKNVFNTSTYTAVFRLLVGTFDFFDGSEKVFDKAKNSSVTPRTKWGRRGMVVGRCNTTSDFTSFTCYKIGE